MPAIRFRSRHLHATFYNDVQAKLATLGWVTPLGVQANFGTDALEFMDYQPDERAVQIKKNTLAVSLGDYDSDDDEELGAKGGGLRSAEYNVYFDVYMEQQPLTHALCDDIRDIYTDRVMDLVDQITGTAVPACYIEIDAVIGPEHPATGVDQFRRYWRSMRLDAILYFPS